VLWWNLDLETKVYKDACQAFNELFTQKLFEEILVCQVLGFNHAIDISCGMKLRRENHDISVIF